MNTWQFFSKLVLNMPKEAEGVWQFDCRLWGMPKAQAPTQAPVDGGAQRRQLHPFWTAEEFSGHSGPLGNTLIIHRPSSHNERVIKGKQSIILRSNPTLLYMHFPDASPLFPVLSIFLYLLIWFSGTVFLILGRWRVLFKSFSEFFYLDIINKVQKNFHYNI